MLKDKCSLLDSDNRELSKHLKMLISRNGDELEMLKYDIRSLESRV